MKENDFYKLLNENGFFKVYETYYKDEYDCYQFYCTGFINSEIGYNWLIAISNNQDTDIDVNKTLFDLYIVTKGNSKWNRKDKKLFTGTLKQVLEYSKHIDKIGYKNAIRQNELKIYNKQ